MVRPLPEDLLLAAEWLDCYEPAPDDDGQPRMAAVAAWLRGQCDAKMREAFIRKAVRETGCSRSRAAAHFDTKYTRS